MLYNTNATRVIGAFALLALGAGACSDREGTPYASAPRVVEPVATNTFGNPNRFSGSFTAEAPLRYAVNIADCQGGAASSLTLSGAITLPGLGAQLRFTNNAKGTHTYDDTVNVSESLVVADGSLTIPPATIRDGNAGGTGNTYIWAQAVGDGGQILSGESYIGECAPGQREGELAVKVPTAASVSYAVKDCDNGPGATIALDGVMQFTSSVVVRLIFRDAADSASAIREQDINGPTVLAAGHSVRFSKQPVASGVGGNPWILASLTDGDGQPVTEQVVLGRCNQLAGSTAIE
jgi:hypothetical protein